MPEERDKEAWGLRAMSEEKVAGEEGVEGETLSGTDPSSGRSDEREDKGGKEEGLVPQVIKGPREGEDWQGAEVSAGGTEDKAPNRLTEAGKKEGETNLPELERPCEEDL